jgi:hypothetical protein
MRLSEDGYLGAETSCINETKRLRHDSVANNHTAIETFIEVTLTGIKISTKQSVNATSCLNIILRKVHLKIVMIKYFKQVSRSSISVTWKISVTVGR